MKKIIKPSCAAGFIISMCAYMYTVVQNHYVGAFLFAFGLCSIVACKCKLFTGIIGYVENEKDCLNAFLVLIGNIIGAVVFTLIVRTSNIQSYAPNWEAKINTPILTFLWKSVLCGALIHLGVNSYKQGNLIALIMSVMFFVLCGFEHCIANTYYMLNSNVILTIKSVEYYLLNILGNMLGAISIQMLIR